MDEFLTLAFIFLIAGVIAVPIATKFGLGSVLGYLIAGIALGPFLPGLNVDVESVQQFAEFGIVMMLFLVGLELKPHKLWQMRVRLFGMGGLQVGLTTGAVTLMMMALGFSWTIALASALVLAVSSTAIVLQTLSEKGLIRSDGGQASFAVLLFEDVAVIPMLALIPLLATPELLDLVRESASASDNQSVNLIDGLPAWQRALLTAGAIGVVVVGGSFLTRPVFRFIASARLRELFVATALLWVVAIALLMTLVGLSPALGTFLAGVVLANSEYRHELESDIEPFKGLLLGLFFITVGASINLGFLSANLATVFAMTAGLIIIKAIALYALAALFGLKGADRWLLALGLAQAGEFGFVLLSFTVANGVIPIELSNFLLPVITLSMLATPVLFIVYDKIIAPRYAITQGQGGEADAITEEGEVIIAGHGRFGSIVNRMLRASGFSTVVLDHQSSQIDTLRIFGLNAFFGDATRPDLLKAAGIERAKILVVALNDKEQALQLTRYVSTNYPHIHIVARAADRPHVYDLYSAGSRDIIRETFDSAVRTGRTTLTALGVERQEAERRAKLFFDNDRSSLKQLAELYDPDIPIRENKPYIEKAKELMAREATANNLPPEKARLDGALEDVEVKTD